MRHLFVITGLLVSPQLLMQNASCEEVSAKVISDPKPTGSVEQQKSADNGSSTQPLANLEQQKPARLAVGAKAPGFRLFDQNGDERTLKELLAKSKVALVFYRSADW